MTNSPTQTVAANVRAEVARQRISQSRVAEALGMTQQAVSRRINGLTAFSIDELYAASDLLGTDIQTLLEGASASTAA